MGERIRNSFVQHIKLYSMQISVSESGKKLRDNSLLS